MGKSANRSQAQKDGANKRPQTWKPGQSGNPNGAPKRGESWAEIIKRVGEYTPQEAAEKSIELSRQFLKVGEGVTLKEAVVMRVYGALLFEPQPGLLNAFMERTEGKIKDELELKGDKTAPLEVVIRYVDADAGGSGNPEATPSPEENQA